MLEGNGLEVHLMGGGPAHMLESEMTMNGRDHYCSGAILSFCFPWTLALTPVSQGQCHVRSGC